MKIIINIQEDMNENEIHLCVRELNEEVVAIQKIIQQNLSSYNEMVVYQEDVEYYIPLKQILFFETSGREIMLHTKSELFVVKKKLYELEEILPDYFERISKSCVVNVLSIYSMNKKVVSNGLIEFNGTHKQVYVSRMYYKSLKLKLERKRRSYE